MLLYILAYLGGVVTIISPCILPVLPFVFARANRPFMTNGLPMLVGMALMFVVIASLAAVGGSWAVSANQYGRMIALALLALFGLTLLMPRVAERVMRPLVGLGARLSQSAREGSEGMGIGPSLLLGVATGLLWAPCAGPILGLILTGAALQGASVGTSLLLLSYALGAATSLALALLVGGKVFKAMAGSIRATEKVRRALGALVLVAVAGIALGMDTSVLARVSQTGTNRIEQSLLAGLGLDDKVMSGSSKALGDEGPMPSIDGAVAWINSPPLTNGELKGKVVLVDFWTYSCINCLRTMPYLRAWADKYRDAGLVVIGVHAPEFAFERDEANVRRAVNELKIGYPVAIDNHYAIWRAFQNRYWPAHYFIDAKGRVRYHRFGEGGYAKSEQVIQQLLAEAQPGRAFHGTVAISGDGVEAASVGGKLSPETYIGYRRRERSVSTPAAVPDRSTYYAISPASLDQWSLAGDWTVHATQAVADKPGARVVYRFRARDLHMVLGPGKDGKAVRFKVTIDGEVPGADAGLDIDRDGNGTVKEQRLYQLIRLNRPVGEHDFAIEFLDPGVEAFSFTFG